MKKIILMVSIMACSCPVFCQQYSWENIKQISESERNIHFGNIRETNSFAGSNINIIYQRMEWIIDPSVKFITGTITTFFIPLQDSISNVSFDMADNLSVGDISYHAISLNYEHSGNILNIFLPVQIPVNVTDSIIILYYGIPDTAGTGSFVKSEHDGNPIIWTLSEPYGAKDWWPCKQNLSDKIDSVDIYVTSPQQYKVAANGLLVSELNIGGQIITHWKHRYPVAAYLIGVSVTNYVTYFNYAPMMNGDTIKIQNYVYPEYITEAQIKTPRTILVMQLYDSIFTEYPFSNEKYGHAQCGITGGMEHQTMTFTGDFEHEVIAHELAHQWFGDFITCRSWSDIWINEGFAVYLTGLTYEHMFDSYYWLPWKTMQIDDITTEPDGSVFVADTNNIERLFDSRLTYRKGSMLLHMLRWELGDEAFFTGIINYLQDSCLANGYASTENLKDHLEETADIVLNEFFDDWYFGEGYPEYTVDWVQDNHGNVTLSMVQESSDPSVSFFEMTVPLQFKGNTSDTLIKFKNEFSGQQYFFHVNFTIVQVIFDPEKWIITKEPVINGIHNLDSIDSIIVAPVPVIDYVDIYWSSVSNVHEIQICDVNGRSKKEIPVNNEIHVKIGLTDLAQGVYYIKIFTGKSYIIKKFVKI